MLCSAVLCTLLQCSVVQCGDVQCSAMQCSVVQRFAVQCRAALWKTVQFTVVNAVQWHVNAHSQTISSLVMCSAALVPFQCSAEMERRVAVQFNKDGRDYILKKYFEPLCTPPSSFYWRLQNVAELYVIWYLAEPGKVRGCYTNTIVIHSLSE